MPFQACLADEGPVSMLEYPLSSPVLDSWRHLCPLVWQDQHRGESMDRNSRAALSPQEIASLRRLRGDPRHSMASSHRQLLLSMSLIALGADELKLTDAGRNRLVTDEAGNALWGRRPAGLTPASR
jgi:hypothetical protein